VNENRNIKSPGLDLLATAKRKVVRTSQTRLESFASALQDSVIYADTDMRLYFDAAESKAKNVTELSLYTSEGEGLYVTCSQQKWDKTKGIISRILATCPDKGGNWKLDRKTLERD